WDVAGNLSAVASRTFTRVRASPLTARTNGLGNLSPNLDGTWLEEGQLCTMTALPAPGQLFSGWSGDVSSTSPRLSFAMVENMIVQANFVPNPFLAVCGAYQGLCHATNGMEQGPSGFFSAQLTDHGRFTGSLLLSGERVPFAGNFALDGKATNTVVRAGKPDL